MPLGRPRMDAVEPHKNSYPRRQPVLKGRVGVSGNSPMGAVPSPALPGVPRQLLSQAESGHRVRSLGPTSQLLRDRLWVSSYPGRDNAVT